MTRNAPFDFAPHLPELVKASKGGEVELNCYDLEHNLQLAVVALMAHTRVREGEMNYENVQVNLSFAKGRTITARYIEKSEEIVQTN